MVASSLSWTATVVTWPATIATPVLVTAPMTALPASSASTFTEMVPAGKLLKSAVAPDP
ncbi:hypothetical protein D3C86_2091710 [compost metagenome]